MAILSQFRRKKSQTVELTESHVARIPQGAIDREAGIIRGVKIIGRHSKQKGREYSESALQEALPKYEGAMVCLDHNPPGKGAEVRSIRDTWGVLRDVEIRSDGAYGDLHYLKEHAETPAILERHEKGIPMGLSHNARGKSVRRDGREVVESIEHVFSVDLVSRPATTKNLFESEAPTVKTTIKELIEATGYEFTDELLEMMPVAGDMEVEAPEEAAQADPVGAVQAALADEAVKIFLDPNIEPGEKGKQIKTLAKSVEDIANKVNPKPAEEEGEGEGGEGDPPADDKKGDDEKKESLPVEVAKQLKELTEANALIAKKLAAREFLESRKLDPVKIGSERMKELTECEDEAAMTKLVESWPPVLRGAAPPQFTGANAGQKTKAAPRLINARRF